MEFGPTHAWTDVSAMLAATIVVAKYGVACEDRFGGIIANGLQLRSRRGCGLVIGYAAKSGEVGMWWLCGCALQFSVAILIGLVLRVVLRFQGNRHGASGFDSEPLWTMCTEL